MRNQRLAAVTLPDYIPKSGHHNQWGFNPEEQQNRTYLGMGEDDINVHDQWACESMGAIQDRTREHLGSTDKVIMANRRMLLQAMDTVEQGGTVRPASPTRHNMPGSTALTRWNGIAPQRRLANLVARRGTHQACQRPLEETQRYITRVRNGGERNDPFRPTAAASTTPRAKSACQQTARLIEASGMWSGCALGWCDVHGMLRGKTLIGTPPPSRHLRDGVGMVGTMMLKDTADRTAWKVFEPGGADDLPGFANAANLMLLPDPASFTPLPWQANTASLRCQPWFADGSPVPLDTRRVLQQALVRLAQAGYGLKTGLEVEFHIYRITDTVRRNWTQHWPAGQACRQPWK